MKNKEIEVNGPKKALIFRGKSLRPGLCLDSDSLMKLTSGRLDFVFCSQYEALLEGFPDIETEGLPETYLDTLIIVDHMEFQEIVDRSHKNSETSHFSIQVSLQKDDFFILIRDRKRFMIIEKECFCNEIKPFDFLKTLNVFEEKGDIDLPNDVRNMLRGYLDLFGICLRKFPKTKVFYIVDKNSPLLSAGKWTKIFKRIANGRRN